MLGQAVVPDQNRIMIFSNLGREFFCHVYGTVLTAGTADGDREVSPVGVLVVRNPSAKKFSDVIVHGCEFLLRIQKNANLLIESGEAA